MASNLRPLDCESPPITSGLGLSYLPKHLIPSIGTMTTPILDFDSGAFTLATEDYE